MKITILGHSTCTYCKQAMQYLATKGKSFTYLDAKDPDNERTVTELRKEGIQTVPQIWLDHERIGGYDELVKRI